MAKCAVVDCINETKGACVCCSRTCSNKFYPRRKKEFHQCKRCKRQFPGKGNCPECKTTIISNREAFRKTTLGQLAEQCSSKGIHKSWWYSEVRTDARKQSNFTECSVCDYTLHIETCHVKAISSYPPEATIEEINVVTNLIGLCPNHHWEFDNGYLTIETRK